MIQSFNIYYPCCWAGDGLPPIYLHAQSHLHFFRLIHKVSSPWGGVSVQRGRGRREFTGLVGDVLSSDHLLLMSVTRTDVVELGTEASSKKKNKSLLCVDCDYEYMYVCRDASELLDTRSVPRLMLAERLSQENKCIQKTFPLANVH